MAAAPVAQPYWKQAMPAAYSPQAFSSLSPEEQVREKKKAGCCATCCCVCLIILIVIVALGGAAAVCLSDLCGITEATGKSEVYSSDAVVTESTLTKVYTQVTRGSITVQGGASTQGSVVNTVVGEESQLMTNNPFLEVDGEFTSEYTTSGTGINDCYFCRKSDVTVTLAPDVTEATFKCLGCNIEVSGAELVTAGFVDIATTIGEVHVENAITAGGNVRLATDTKAIMVHAAVSGADVDIEAGISTDPSADLHHHIEAAVTASGNLTITAAATAAVDIEAAVSGADVTIQASLGGDVNVETTGSVSGTNSVLFTGAGTTKVKSDVTTPLLTVEATSSGNYEFSALAGGATDIDVTTGVASNVMMTYTCAADTKLLVQATYRFQSSADFAAPVYKIGTTVQDDWLSSNETMSVGGVEYLEVSANRTGCSETGSTVKTLTVDLLLNAGGTFEFTEAA
jgi:hypothetical protein